MIANNDFVM